MADIQLPFTNRVSLKEKAIFAKQLSTMLNAGLNLSTSLEILGRQTRNSYFRQVVSEIHKDLEEGRAFSSLIARYPNIFDRVFLNIIKAGEQSGQLEIVLKQLSRQLDQQYSFISRLRGALIYPIFIVVAMAGVAILASVRIIPQLKGVFEDSGVTLPFSTRVVIAISDFMINYWYLLIIGLAGLVVVIRFMLSSATGRELFDRALIKDPSGLAKRVYMARFARTLGMMLSAGIPIVESVKVVSEVMGNTIYKRGLLSLAQDLERGLPMSVPLQKNPYFPYFVSQMILVGEQTGQLDKILIELADFFEGESEEGIRNITSLFEPLIIVIIGLGIGFLVYSIIIPIYNLAQAQ